MNEKEWKLNTSKGIQEHPVPNLALLEEYQIIKSRDLNSARLDEWDLFLRHNLGEVHLDQINSTGTIWIS